MREELFWDRDLDSIPIEIEIERGINFGGFDYIRNVQKRGGMDKFIEVLINSRNLSRKAVNYWCFILNIDRKKTKTFKTKPIWTPIR